MRLHWRGALGTFVVLVVFAIIGGTAHAEPVPYSPPDGTVSDPALPEGLASCPAAPAAYGGEDPIAAELRSLRIEQAESCEATAARQVLQLHRTFWLAAELVGAGEQRALTNEKLTFGNERLEGLLNQNCSNPCSVYFEGQSKPVNVEASGGTLAVEDTGSEAIVSSVDATGEALRGALWFLAGLLASGLVAYAIYRQVMAKG